MLIDGAFRRERRLNAINQLGRSSRTQEFGKEFGMIGALARKFVSAPLMTGGSRRTQSRVDAVNATER